MPYYTLKPGHQCGFNGRDLKPGEVIELPEHVGREVSEKLMPCTQTGESLAELSAEELAIAQAADHEKASLPQPAPRSAPIARRVTDAS